MKNYWLDKKESFTVGDLENLVIEFQKTRLAEDAIKLTQMFELLAKNILAIGYKIKFDDTRQVISECVKIAFAKIDRFIPGKGKAFNYFTTIMLCQMRQIYRVQKSYKELKEHYAQFLVRSKEQEKMGKSGNSQ